MRACTGFLLTQKQTQQDKDNRRGRELAGEVARPPRPAGGLSAGEPVQAEQRRGRGRGGEGEEQVVHGVRSLLGLVMG